MRRPTWLLIPLLIVFAAGAGYADDPKATEEEPEKPGIKKVEPGTDIGDIKSDTFKMSEASIDGDTLKIKVSYSGGTKKHVFELYWNQIVARSYPGQTTIHLKHDANGDNAEALLTQTLEFDLTAINQPMIITIKTDHGDSIRVQYGEP